MYLGISLAGIVLLLSIMLTGNNYAKREKCKDWKKN